MISSNKRRFFFLFVIITCFFQAGNAKVKFLFNKLDSNPVLDLAPGHARMTTCYQDLAGVYHLFVDFIPASQETQHSWRAEILHFTSRDLLQWEYVEKVVGRGNYNSQNPDSSDFDSYGAASPGVIAKANNKVYLFYAGRRCLQSNHNGDPMQCNGSNRVASRIMLATAESDSNGAPVTPFIKKGVVLDLEKSWHTCRLDDPSALFFNNRLCLFFKGFSERNLDSIRVGLAEAVLPVDKFIEKEKPVFVYPKGVEMPRVFQMDGKLFLFIRTFQPQSGSIWKCYESFDGKDWSLLQDDLFNCVTPGKGATDMAPVYSLEGELSTPMHALATGDDEGILKIYLYKITLLRE